MSRVRTIAATAVLTSLGWIAAIAGWTITHPALAPRAPRPASPSQPVVSPAGPAASAASLAIPVAGVGPSALIDTFTQARAAGARHHDAIDIPAPRGTPVLSAAPGTVEKLFLSDDGGRTIYVRSPDGARLYYYAHLDAYAPGLAEGDRVARGDVLGSVGSTGNANPAAPHLHFAVLETTATAKWYEPALALNPYSLLTRR